MTAVYIVDAIRTPMGRRNGGLSKYHPADLAGNVLKGLVDRADIDPELVDDVVMEERCRMNELHDCSKFDVMLAAVAGRSCRQEHERRAQPLAAPGDDVFRDLTDEDHVGLKAAPDHRIHREHIGGDQVAEKFGLQRGTNGLQDST